MPLDIHFINVGKGSCTAIMHPSGRLTVIDVDDSRAPERAHSPLEELLSSSNISKGVSRTNPIEYISQNFSNAQSIFRFILTHPDMDHMSGVKLLYDRKPFINFWDISHERPDPGNWEHSPYDESDWGFYQDLRIRRVSGVTLIHNERGETGQYWTEDGITILHPHGDLLEKVEETDTPNYDHLSHVLKINHAGRSVLLCSDATPEALEHIYHDQSVDETANIILAPGHGSKNHIHEDMLKNAGHKLTIVSVAEGVDYDYDFYSKFGPVLSTKYFGNIRLYLDDNGKAFVKTQSGDYSDRWYGVSL